MAVPDHFHIVTETFNAGQYDLTNHADHARFVDDVVIALHAEDPRWGHLKKKPGQTQIHGHGEDSALYKLPSNAAQAVDFIGGAGGPHPTLRWGVDGFPYTHADWLDPADHENGPPPQPPMPTQPPGREEALDELNELHRYYQAPEGLQRPDGLWRPDLNTPDFEGIAAWYLDVYQRDRMAMMSRADSRADYVNQIRHSDEWKAKHPGETP